MRLGGRISAAIDILADMESRHRPAAEALKDWGLSHRFAGAGDRAAIGNIVYDALRWRRSLAVRTGGEEPVRLALGAVLKAGETTPEELVRSLDGDRFAPELPDDLRGRWVSADLGEAPLAMRADLPDWLVPPFESAFGADALAEGQALSERPPLDLRANRLKADPDKVLKALSVFEAGVIPHVPDGIRIPPIIGNRRHPNVQAEAGFQKGWFEIQDAGSQLAARLAGADGGMQVLDLCAGGGGKTLALAALMGNRGQIHATDNDRQRLAPIHERLKRAGVRNTQIHDPRTDLAALEGAMDLVLVDAPCSGTGTWRRRPDAKWRLGPEALDKRIAEQDAVLERAARFVRPAGRLVYVTCSMLPAENGERILAFLARHPAFGMRETAEHWPTGPDGSATGDLPARLVPLEAGNALQFTPLLTGTDGFFVASMERRS